VPTCLEVGASYGEKNWKKKRKSKGAGVKQTTLEGLETSGVVFKCYYHGESNEGVVGGLTGERTHVEGREKMVYWTPD